MTVMRRRYARGVPTDHPVVEIDGMETIGLRRRERKMNHGRGVDLRSAGVLHSYRNAEGDGDITNLPGRADSADARNLDRDTVGYTVPLRDQKRLKGVNVFVEHHRVATLRP